MIWPGASLTSKILEIYKQSYLSMDIGDWSYGKPTVRLTVQDHPRKLSIGRYCSIGDGVEIFVGRQGRHPLDTLTTYPVLMAVTPSIRSGPDIFHDRKELFSPSLWPSLDNLDVTIGDDVWIGAQAMIFAGVTIGTGAVIGARSVVSRDVPPFAVVAGAPAKVLRYRHEPDVVDAILKSEWWTLEPDELWARCGSLIGSTNVLDVLSLITADKNSRDQRSESDL